MYQIIVISTIGFLVIITLLAVLIDWGTIGYKYFPQTFKMLEDE